MNPKASDSVFLSDVWLNAFIGRQRIGILSIAKKLTKYPTM